MTGSISLMSEWSDMAEQQVFTLEISAKKVDIGVVAVYSENVSWLSFVRSDAELGRIPER